MHRTIESLFRTASMSAVLLVALCACTTNGTTAAEASSPDASAVASPSMQTPTPAGDAGAMQCNAANAQSAVGQVADPGVVEQAVKSSGSANARVIKPGQPVTMDYRGDRLNLDVDAKNMITAVRCG